MSKIKFIKMNGAGNDFILIDASKNRYLRLMPGLIRELCDRRRGIGADGILLIEEDDAVDYKLTYFNSDGSVGSLCGNGSRCSIFYYSKYVGSNKDEIKFTCNGEIFSGNVNKEDEISFNLPDPAELELNIILKIDDYTFNAHFVKVGSPHLIIFWNDIKMYFDKTYGDFNLNTFGRLVRNSEYFSPAGTNVNIVNIKDEKLYIRTYERGVEEETLSCGTGTGSAAVVTSIIKGINSPLSFITYGGDLLRVSFNKNEKKISKITLTGPVKINYIGSCNF